MIGVVNGQRNHWKNDGPIRSYLLIFVLNLNSVSLHFECWCNTRLKIKQQFKTALQLNAKEIYASSYRLVLSSLKIKHKQNKGLARLEDDLIAEYM